MKSATETEQEFKADLKALLAKYGAEIELEDVGRDWSREYVISVCIPAVYNMDHDCEREFCLFRLRTWMNGDNV